MVVMLPFSQVEKTDATDLLKAQHTTGAAVRLFIKLGKAFEDNEEERQQIAKELGVEEQFNSEGIKESRIHKTYTILTHVCFLKAQYRRRRYLCIFRKVSFLLS